MATYTPSPTEAPATPPRKRPLPLRIVRFPLKIVLMAIVGFFMLLRRHPRVSVGVLVVLLAAGGAVYYFTPAIAPVGVSSSATTGTGLTSVQGLAPSPQAPYQFFKAQQSGDASAIWGLLSDSYKQGASLQQLQAQLEQAKPNMGVIKKISYVGGAKEQNGNGVYLYLLTLDQGGQTAQVTYLFTLDQQGKIVKIE